MVLEVPVVGSEGGSQRDPSLPSLLQMVTETPIGSMNSSETLPTIGGSRGGSTGGEKGGSTGGERGGSIGGERGSSIGGSSNGGSSNGGGNSSEGSNSAVGGHTAEGGSSIGSRNEGASRGARRGSVNERSPSSSPSTIVLSSLTPSYLSTLKGGSDKDSPSLLSGFKGGSDRDMGENIRRNSCFSVSELDKTHALSDRNRRKHLERMSSERSELLRRSSLQGAVTHHLIRRRAIITSSLQHPHMPSPLLLATPY